MKKKLLAGLTVSIVAITGLFINSNRGAGEIKEVKGVESSTMEEVQEDKVEVSYECWLDIRKVAETTIYLSDIEIDEIVDNVLTIRLKKITIMEVNEEGLINEVREPIETIVKKYYGEEIKCEFEVEDFEEFKCNIGDKIPSKKATSIIINSGDYEIDLYLLNNFLNKSVVGASIKKANGDYITYEEVKDMHLIVDCYNEDNVLIDKLEQGFTTNNGSSVVIPYTFEDNFSVEKYSDYSYFIVAVE